MVAYSVVLSGAPSLARRAEREGFEPPELSLNCFQDSRHKPLGHLSVVWLAVRSVRLNFPFVTLSATQRGSCQTAALKASSPTKPPEKYTRARAPRSTHRVRMGRPRTIGNTENRDQVVVVLCRRYVLGRFFGATDGTLGVPDPGFERLVGAVVRAHGDLPRQRRDCQGRSTHIVGQLVPCQSLDYLNTDQSPYSDTSIKGPRSLRKSAVRPPRVAEDFGWRVRVDQPFWARSSTNCRCRESYPTEGLTVSRCAP
jgi:hypothetical protein